MNLGFGLNVDETAQETGYDKYEVSLFESLGAVAADNWNFNPVMSLWNYSDLSEARNKSKFNKENMIDRLELNKEHAKIGLYFEEDEYQSVVDIMVREKNEERARQNIMMRGPRGSWNPLSGGFYVGAAKFATGLATSMVDPINVAASFIPVFGQTNFARLVARQGFTKARAVRGAVEGAVGATLVEPIVYGVAQSLQADYDMYDSFLNVTFGTVLGSGLHVGAGKLKDINTRRKFNEKIAEGKRILGDDTETDIDINLYREYYPENSQIMKDLEATDPNTRKMLLQKALGDALLDDAIDVTPIANADPVLRNSSDSSPNPDIRTTPKQSIDDVELKNLEDNIVNRNDIEQDAEIEVLQAQLETVKESQKDLDLQFEQGDSEIKLKTEDLDEVTTKKKELDEAIKDAINCVNGR
nr:putative internal virion protein [uncultured Mediterranean phage uvMED]|tara:strand:- start:639 stop:1880 length:1242 start_codon:yes stop_codon:yes gene_type:complete